MLTHRIFFNSYTLWAIKSEFVIVSRKSCKSLSSLSSSSTPLYQQPNKRHNKFHEHSVYDGKLRKRIREEKNQPTIGAITMSYGSDTDHIEMLGLLGYDFLWADTEHSCATPESIHSFIIAAERRGMPTIVRIGYGYQNIIGHVQKYLVSGAQGILLPQCESKEDVKQLVNAVKFPPIGRRGLAGERWNAWGLGNLDKEKHLQGKNIMGERLKKCNENSIVAVAIENKKGIDALDEILDVEELDFVFVAPMDLSVDLGYEGDLKHPDVTDTIEKIGKQIIGKGKAAGMLALDSNDYAYWRKRGFTVICCWAQFLFRKAASDFIQDASEYENNADDD